MTETITKQNAKALHAICKEKGVEMRGSESSSQIEAGDYATNKEIFIKTKDKNNIFVVYPRYTTNELLKWLPNVKLLSFRETDDIFTAETDAEGLLGEERYERYVQSRDMFAENEFSKNAKTPQDALCLLLIELISKDLLK